jgi:hypothetical protein
LTPYQLQQLSKETGIPLATLQTALAGATQASMAQDFAAVQAAGITPTVQVPPKDGPAPPPPPKTSSIINTKAAVGLSLAAAAAFTFFLWYARGDMTQAKQNVFIFLAGFLVISAIITVGLVVANKDMKPAYAMGGLSIVSFVGVAIFAGTHGGDLFKQIGNTGNPLMNRLTNMSSAIAGNTMASIVGALGVLMFITGMILIGYLRNNPKSPRAGQLKKAAIPLATIGGFLALAAGGYSFYKSSSAPPASTQTTTVEEVTQPNPVAPPTGP